MINKRFFTVREVSTYIKAILEEDIILSEVFIDGEISNFKAHSSGHLYFSLKDDFATINCVMFKPDALSLSFIPKDGLRVLVFGRVSLYEKTGKYQLYVNLIQPFGQGNLFLKFEELKNKLKKEGLFDLEHKKEIPEKPNCVAIITSKTGAAVKDIINVSKRRNKNIDLVIVHTLVQGEGAPKEICNAIKMVNDWNKADVIILGRGGGSMEDLWAFNDEKVARSIYNSKIPIVSAIGHETDFTIADFAADIRASTPSSAAEIVVPSLDNEFGYTISLINKLNNLISKKISFYKKSLNQIINNKHFKRPLNNIYEKQMYLEGLTKNLEKQIVKKFETTKNILENKIALLNSLSPINILNRGFIIATKNKEVVKSSKELKENDLINLKFSDGEIKAIVK